MSRGNNGWLEEQHSTKETNKKLKNELMLIQKN